MKIFRIQDNKGRGPWKPGFSNKWVVPRGDHENLIPIFMEEGFKDIERGPNGYHGVGCSTIDKLKRWFTKREYDTLIKYGYKAVELEVDRILLESDVQTLFERKKALRKNVKPFNLYK